MEGPNRFAGVLLDKTLNYDPHNEFWEKRLAKYFMVYFRSGASKGYHPIKLQTLFDELNLPINERFPQRTRDRFEKAMDTLQKDGHLTWDYAASVKLPSRNWISTWIGGSIAVDPPKSIRDQYRSIATHAQVVRSQSRMQRKPRQKN